MLIGRGRVVHNGQELVVGRRVEQEEHLIQQDAFRLAAGRLQHEALTRPPQLVRRLAFGRYEVVESVMGKRKPRVQQAEIVQQFGARLREPRQARDTTQADLARAAQVARSHLSKLEKGEAAPGLDLLDRLAKASGTTVLGLLPPPAPAGDVVAQRDQIRKVFESVLGKAGGETLQLLERLLAYLAESPSTKR